MSRSPAEPLGQASELSEPREGDSDSGRVLLGSLVRPLDRRAHLLPHAECQAPAPRAGESCACHSTAVQASAQGGKRGCQEALCCAPLSSLGAIQTGKRAQGAELDHPGLHSQSGAFVRRQMGQGGEEAPSGTSRGAASWAPSWASRSWRWIPSPLQKARESATRTPSGP